jgi:hypothetical protein
LTAEVGWIVNPGHLTPHLSVSFSPLAQGKNGRIATDCSFGYLPDLCHECHSSSGRPL